MKIKKHVALLLAIIMLVGIFPTVTFAAPPNPPSEQPWAQRPVHDAIVLVGDTGNDMYNLTIRWSRPRRSTVPAPRSAGLTPALLSQAAQAQGDDVWTIYPIRYLVHMRNATRNEAFGERLFFSPVMPPENGQVRDPGRTPPGAPPPTHDVVFSQNINMQPASLYEINIEPVRFVPIPVPPIYPATEITYGFEQAPVDNAAGGGHPPGRNILFLTDIVPQVDARDRVLTVTWPDPSFGLETVFPYWEISFVQYHPPQPIAPGQFPFIRRVGGEDAGSNEIRRNPDGTLSTTISHDSIRPIGHYAIRIEPMLGPTPGMHMVRDIANPIVTIAEQQYTLSFTENEYIQIATMIPRLHIDQIGAQFLRLWWPDLTTIINEIQFIEVEEWPVAMEGIVPESASGRIRSLAMFSGPFRTNNQHFVGPGIPSEPRGFALAIHFRPEAGGNVIRTEVEVFNPLIAEFSPYRPEIESLAHAGDGAISMEWLAFARFPAVPGEVILVPDNDRFGGRFVDTALFYEIFVSNNWADMALIAATGEYLIRIDPSQLNESERPSLLRPPPLEIWDPTWLLWEFDYIRYYQARTPTGIEVRRITGNEVYFVWIRAVRDTGERSRWAYGSIYVPPLEELEVIPEMISAPPVHIVREGANYMDLAWDFRYLEIMQPFMATTPAAIQAERNLWHTVIGATNNEPPMPPRLIFGRSSAHINYTVDNPLLGAPPRHAFLNNLILPAYRERLLGLEEFPVNLRQPANLGVFLTDARSQIIDRMATEWGYPHVNDPPMALRVQDTTGFRYEIHAVPYATVRQFNGGFEGYRDNFLRVSPEAWRSIGSPEIVNGVVNYKVTGLTPNTPYIIFIRPYVITGGQQIRAAYPTFVIGTTIIAPVRPTPDPTTPVLFPVPRYTTRNRVGVRWRVQADTIYTLNISHFFTDYPDGGIEIELSYEDITAALNGETVELEEPRAILDVQEVDGIRYFHLQIMERFPNTQYYIWAVALGVDEAGEVNAGSSQPSNPVDIRTLDIEPPPPPRSFGRAPQRLLDSYNQRNDTEHRANEPDAIILSWMRIFADLRDDMGNLTERADAGEGDATPLNLPNLEETEAYVAMHMVRFDDLVANRRHYARARTILTVTRGEADVYSYEIELADNEDFFDSVTFTIPPAVELDPLNMRRAMSEWVHVEVDTGMTDDEFDGVHRPDQYPLPERDFEITYDAPSQTLTWRFRTNQRGADGRLDQNVDQRFITRLVQSRVFTYTIDMSEHAGMPISNREIILPESILRAFGERRIALEILTGDTNIVIPPGALDTAQMRGLQPGIGTYHHITVNNVMTGMPPLTPNTEFATVPQRFSIRAATPSRSEILTTFARPVQVVLPVERFTTPEGLSTGLFVNDTNAATWRDTQGALNFATNSLSSTISAPTTFAAITRNTPQATQVAHPSNHAMQRVTSRLTITDMQAFNPNHQVSANEFNNIVNAIVNNRTSVTLGANLSAADTRSLTNARLLAPANLTREDAIDIMVRLYENRTRQILTPMTPAASVPGIQNTSPTTHRNMRVAADLGFITGPLEPQGHINMGELMSMVDIIMQDSGM